MGDSGAEDTSDSLTDADLDQIASDAEAIQEGPKSNIVGSSSYDAQFTADQLEDRGLDPSNFMAAENFAQTTQGGFTGGTGPQETTINVPSVQAADTTPTFSAAGVSDVFDPMTTQARSDTMIEALGATRDLTPEQKTFAGLSDVLTRGLRDRAPEQTKQQRGLQAVAQTLGQVREKQALDPSGIDFGVTDAPVGSTVGDDFGPALDMMDARTTATGAFDPDAIMEEEEKFGTLPAQTLADIERLSNVPVGQRRTGKGDDPLTFERLGLPSIFDGIERLSRDRMAARLARGDVPEEQIVRNSSGLVMGIKDASGRLVEGVDPSAQMQESDSPDPQKKLPPKQPTDPCPEGFQLIDGACTPVGGTETDTGFVVFPPGRNPSFQRGPFTPATVATNPGIRGLNPVTFNIPQNIFRR